MIRKTYTTFYIAELLDVYPTTVAKWIDEKKLKAYLTPGGHRRVRHSDLVNFLKKYNAPIPEEFREDIRILLVDDDLEILNAMHDYLLTKNNNFDIIKATDGFAAGKAFHSFNPDIIILDIKLPGINGIKVCNMIREENERVKIIAITAYKNNTKEREIEKAGANIFLKKPFKLDILYDKIKLLLEE